MKHPISMRRQAGKSDAMLSLTVVEAQRILDLHTAGKTIREIKAATGHAEDAIRAVLAGGA